MKSDWFPTIAATKEEAIRNGSKSYAMNGIPCDRGHLSSIRVEDDKCMACVVEDRNKKARPETQPMIARSNIENILEDRELASYLKDPWD